MENLEWIISLASATIGLIITVATVIVKYAKSAKAKKIAEQALAICNAMIPYIKEAESYVNYSGAEKKAYVMMRAQQYAFSQKMQIDEKLMSDKVEELITLSKEVNAREKTATRNNIITIPAR